MQLAYHLSTTGHLSGTGVVPGNAGILAPRAMLRGGVL